MNCEILHSDCTNVHKGRCSFCVVAERKILFDPENLPSQERSAGTQEFTDGDSLVVIETYVEDGKKVDYRQTVRDGVYTNVRQERK